MEVIKKLTFDEIYPYSERASQLSHNEYGEFLTEESAFNWIMNDIELQFLNVFDSLINE